MKMAWMTDLHLERLDADGSAAPAEDLPDDGEDDAVGGPIALAINLADAAPDGPAQPVPTQGAV